MQQINCYIPIKLCLTGRVALYRAVDQAGRAVDVLLSKRRDSAAALRFLSPGDDASWRLNSNHVDGCAVSHRAVAKLKSSRRVGAPRAHSILQVLNNVTLAGNRRIKQRVLSRCSSSTAPETAAVTVLSIPVGRKDKKTSFNLATLAGKTTGAPEIWVAVFGCIDTRKRIRRTKTYTYEKFAPEPV